MKKILLTISILLLMTDICFANLRPIRALDGTLYVPMPGFKQIDIPTPYPDGGMVLLGTVEKDFNDPKVLNLYNISVIFSKDETLTTMKPEEEETVLNNIFISLWDSMKRNVKVATKQELISKEFCVNSHGKKYLKFASISGNPNRPNLDSLNKTAIQIFGDTGYFIEVSAMVNFAKKYEDELDVILDSFMVKQKIPLLAIEIVSFYWLT